jgi:hypothetical protein
MSTACIFRELVALLHAFDMLASTASSCTACCVCTRVCTGGGVSGWIGPVVGCVHVHASVYICSSILFQIHVHA